MLGDPHTRTSHRATPEGGLGLLTRQRVARPAQAGQALVRQVIVRQALARQTAPEQAAPRHAPARRAPREPQQTLQTLLSGLAALIITAIVGLSAFFIVAEERRGHGGDSVAPPAVSEAAISSRAADPEPLSQQEVFPETQLRLVSGAAPYEVTMTHIDTDCRIATTGALGTLLDSLGCDQVVRAGLTAPFGGYQVTAGIFNLTDEAGAAQAGDLTGSLVESGRGSFAAMGGLGSDPLTEPLAQVGWHARGHYLLYCVIARPDGHLVTDDDPYAERITADLVEQYLSVTIIGGRAAQP